MKIPNAQINSYLQKIAQEKIAGCLVFGPEASVVKYRFDFIAKKITPDLSDPFLVSNISKERLSEDKGLLADEFFAMSMLGGRKLIIIREADIVAGGALKLLMEDTEYANKSDNFILILGGDLDKSSPLRKAAEGNKSFAAIPCYEDSEHTIKNFIESLLSKNGIQTNQEVIRLLVEKLGKNRQIITSEIEKITLYLGEEKKLTLDIVNEIAVSQGEISANEFIMSFAAKKFDISLLQVEKLFKNGFEPIMLIRFLSNYLQKLYHSKVEITSGDLNFEEAVKKQRLFFKTEIEFKKHLKGLSLEFLIEKLDILAKLEIKIKNGTMPSRLVITNFIQDQLRK